MHPSTAPNLRHPFTPGDLADAGGDRPDVMVQLRRSADPAAANAPFGWTIGPDPREDTLHVAHDAVAPLLLQPLHLDRGEGYSWDCRPRPWGDRETRDRQFERLAMPQSVRPQSSLIELKPGEALYLPRDGGPTRPVNTSYRQRPIPSRPPPPSCCDDGDPLRRPMSLTQWLIAVTVLILFIVGLCMFSSYAPPEPR